MSGRTELVTLWGAIAGSASTGPILAIALTAAFTDLWRGKIYNWLTLPAAAAGVLALTSVHGWTGLGQALAGACVGFALYAWMFWLRFLGGGDVKLLMALGAWGGAYFALEVGLLSVLVGGALSASILIIKGRIGGFARRMARSAMTLFVRELEFELPRVDRSMTMPFGVPMAVAAIWTALGHPLAKLWG